MVVRSVEEVLIRDYYSWTIHGMNTAVKHMDMSSFCNFGTGVPKEICWFFNTEAIDESGRMEVVLHFEDESFDDRLTRDPLGRIRLMWKSDLQKYVNTLYDYEKLHEENNLPDMVFERTAKPNEYLVRLTYLPSNYIVTDGDPEDLQDYAIGQMSFEPVLDGRRREVYSHRYERDPKNRERFMALHPHPVCAACGFDFEEFYGVRGKNFIEVHHIRPLSSLDGKGTEIDVENDLICLCSNCHRMVHRVATDVLSLDELKRIINKQHRFDEI